MPNHTGRASFAGDGRSPKGGAYGDQASEEASQLGRAPAGGGTQAEGRQAHGFARAPAEDAAGGAGEHPLAARSVGRVEGRPGGARRRNEGGERGDRVQGGPRV